MLDCSCRTTTPMRPCCLIPLPVLFPECGRDAQLSGNELQQRRPGRFASDQGYSGIAHVAELYGKSQTVSALLRCRISDRSGSLKV